MRRNRIIVLPVLLLAMLACNTLTNIQFTRLKTGPTETFNINETAPAGTPITKASLTMAPSLATMALAGGASGLVEGEIQYNVAEWKPTLSIDNDTLNISQKVDGTDVKGAPEGGVNEWDLKLGGELMNVHVECPAGDFTLDFADTLSDGTTITIDMGAGNMHLIVPRGIDASVNITRGPSTVSTEGTWSQNGSSYNNGGSGSAWTIDITMGVGNLTLVSR